MRFSQDYPNDLQRAIDWYDEVSVRVADQFYREMLGTLRSIEAFPESFAIARKHIRTARIRRFPWVIAFRLDKGTVTILRLVHTASDWIP
jgi:plasmid stabilization system protein ParE